MSDWDLPEFYNTKRLYGRKDHRCSECRRTIRRGEFHGVATGKWDGRIETFRTCIHCHMLAEWACRANEDNDGYPFGRLLEEVHEYLRDGGGVGLDVARAWVAAARLRWRSSRTGLLLPVPRRLSDPPSFRAPWEPPRRRRPRDYDFTEEGWEKWHRRNAWMAAS